MAQENRFRLFCFHVFLCGSNFIEFYNNRIQKVMNLGIFKIHWWEHYVGDINKMGNSSYGPQMLSYCIFSPLIDREYGFVKNSKSFCLCIRMLDLTQHWTRNGSLGGERHPKRNCNWTSGPATFQHSTVIEVLISEV